MSGGKDFDPTMPPSVLDHFAGRPGTTDRHPRHDQIHATPGLVRFGPGPRTIVHRLGRPAPAPSTIPDHQVVSLDELRTRGDL